MPDYSDILKVIGQSVEEFVKKIPAAQKRMLSGITDELKRLDTSNGKIKTTVANLKIIQSVKNKLTRLIVTPEYVKDVKQFAQAFNQITTLQNIYWQSVEADFKPAKMLKEIRVQTIQDTVKALAGSGIGVGIGNEISTILRTNITTGGSYFELTEQLRDKLVNTKSEGTLQKYVRQIVTDSINQYNAQYTEAVSSDLGFEWYAWQGSEIMTSRPFCQAMVEHHRYFHVSQIPNLLLGLDALGVRMEYTDNATEEIKKVEIYSKTGLPNGFIPGTNASNFLVNRGGYFCGHQPRPVSERIVPLADREIVYGTAAYKAWKGTT